MTLQLHVPPVQKVRLLWLQGRFTDEELCSHKQPMPCSMLCYCHLEMSIILSKGPYIFILYHVLLILSRFCMVCQALQDPPPCSSASFPAIILLTHFPLDTPSPPRCSKLTLAKEGCDLGRGGSGQLSSPGSCRKRSADHSLHS